MTPSSHVAWATNVVNTSCIYNGFNQSNGGQNSERSFYVTMAAGAWEIELMYAKSTNTGIITVQIDGYAVGTIDLYAASFTPNEKSTISAVNINTSGRHTLRLLMATKNASSSDYNGSIQHIQLRRTA